MRSSPRTPGAFPRPGTARALMALVVVYFAAQACPPPGGNPDTPVVLQPLQHTVIQTEATYVAVKVLPNESFDVELTLEGQAAQSVTSQFVFAGLDTDNKEIHHANLLVPTGNHRVRAIQYIASSGSTLYSAFRDFSRTLGAIRELGPLGDTSGNVLGQRAKGVLERAAGGTWILFGETRLSGPTVHPSSQSRSATSETDASDGLHLVYFDEPNPIQSVLDLAPANPGENDEEEVWLSAPFEQGSDVFALYSRIDRDATPVFQGVGLAQALGGVLPFQRLAFPAAQPPGGGHFDDDYSLFQAGDFPQVRGIIFDGTHLLLFGQQEGASGLPEDTRVVVARVPLADADDPAAYEYWTDVGGVRAWRSNPAGLVPLWENASPPSVSWNGHLGRWLAVYTQEYGILDPYTVEGTRSAIQLRVADDPRGPWSAPQTVWSKPPTAVGAEGTALDALQLGAFDAGSLVYLVATDVSDPLANPSAELFEVDLAQLTLPTEPIAPELNAPPSQVTDNPHAVIGYASPGDTVTLYVDGMAQESAVAGADGSFSIDAVLLDGPNSVHAVAERGGVEGPPSNTISIDYENTIPRTQSGTLSADTVWTKGDGTPYTITGDLTVANGATFTLQAGVQLQFAGSYRLVQDGVLRIQGTAAEPVILRGASPVRGFWKGVVLNGTSDAHVLTHATIEHAERAIQLANGTVTTTSNLTIREFSVEGIGTSSSISTASALIQDSIIDNSAGAQIGTGISVRGQASDIAVSNNAIRGASTGLFVDRGSAPVTANTIEANATGLVFKWGTESEVSQNKIRLNGTGIALTSADPGSPVGQPDPWIHHNEIRDNAVHNLHTGTSWTSVDAIVDAGIRAEHNYWGSIDPEMIAASIFDRADDPAKAATVDFVPFLQANGLPVGESNLLNGRIVADLTLTAGGVYHVAGSLAVASNATLTVPGGCELRFGQGAGLAVDGALSVQGTVGNEAIFAPLSEFSPGTWTGIAVTNANPNTTIDHALIEYPVRGIEILSPGRATITNSRIREFAEDGIRINRTSPTLAGVTATLADNLVEDATGLGRGIEIRGGVAAVWVERNTIQGAGIAVWLQDATLGAGTLEIRDNALTGNTTGLFIKWTSNPVVVGNLIAQNQDGIVLQASPFNPPQPWIEGNELRANANYNLDAGINWPDDPTLSVDAESNYWGNTDPATIAAEIFDRSDDTRSVPVDFVPFLDASGNPVGTGNLLSGSIGTMTLDPAIAYEVAGTLIVEGGETLTVPAGTTLAFTEGAALIANGTLSVQGSGSDPVHFTSASATPMRGAWQGIDVVGAGSTIESAIIEYAVRGIEIFDQASLTLTGGVIREFTEDAIRATDGAGLTVDGVTVDNRVGGQAGDGIHLEEVTGTVLVQNSQIFGADRGIFLQRTDGDYLGNHLEANGDGIEVAFACSPHLAGNEITGNGVGVDLRATQSGSGEEPRPMLIQNRMHGNATANLRLNLSWPDPDGVPLDVEGNYWGAVDPVSIAATILDRTEDDRRVIADFVPFRDAEGTVVPVGNLLVGYVDDAVPLAAGTTYDAVGALIVPAGSTLTVPQGASLRVLPGARMRALGTLRVLGVVAEPVTFSSLAATPSPGDWVGIEILDGTGASRVDFATIEHAQTGVDIRGVPATVADSTVMAFSEVGIRITQGSTAIVRDNVIDNDDQNPGTALAGTGVFVDEASPTLTGNVIRNTLTGIFVRGGSSPSVTGGNSITANGSGIWLQGTGAPGGNPTPTINQNTIAGNVDASGTERNLVTSGFLSSDPTVINARENYWGSVDEAAILATITHEGDANVVPVDISDYLDSPGGNVVPDTGGIFSYLLGGVRASPVAIRPTFGGQATIEFSLVQAAAVTIVVYEEADDLLASPVRMLAQALPLGAGGHSFSWDGRDAQGDVVADDAYVYVIDAVAAATTSHYEPARPTGFGTGFVLHPSTYAPFRNEFYKASYDVQANPVRLDVVITPTNPDGTPGVPFHVWDDKALQVGPHLFVYDGRGPSGDILTSKVKVTYEAPTRLKPNVVIVRDTKPAITGNGTAPAIEVRSDPYLVQHSHEQVSRIVYRVDRDSFVTVKLLRPGASDPSVSGDVVATLVDHQLRQALDASQQPIDHQFEWLGYDPTDTNDVLSSDEGAFTFTIEATDAGDPSLASVYRGVLQVRR